MEKRQGFMKDGGTAYETGWQAWRQILLLTAVLCTASLLSGMTALADVIWTPNDSFYEKYYDDCEYVGRRYYANGSEGYVRVMEEPGKSNTVDAIANGAVFYVSMSYEDGPAGRWGLVQYCLDEEGRPVEDYSWEGDASVGWIHMADLVAVYDGRSFAEEHASQIRETDQDSMPQVSVPESGVIYLWQYPGSELLYNKLDFKNGGTQTDYQEMGIQIDKIYEDSDGTVWGHSVYYYGNKDFWVNLTNPGEEHPKILRPEMPDLIPAMDQKELADLSGNKQSQAMFPMAVAGLIVLVVAATAAVIHLMAVKKNRDKIG